MLRNTAGGGCVVLAESMFMAFYILKQYNIISNFVMSSY